MANPFGGEGAACSPAEFRHLAADAWEAVFSAQATVIKKLQRDEVFCEVSMREYDVLYHLSKCPDGWTKLGDLNQQVLLTQPSISRLVDRLHGRGLVERKPDTEDRRGVLVRLTEAGRELQTRVGRMHLSDIESTVGPALSVNEMRQLQHLASKLRDKVLSQTN